VVSGPRIHRRNVSGIWSRLHRAESETLAGLLTTAERDAVNRRLGLPSPNLPIWVPASAGPLGGRFTEPQGPGALYLGGDLQTCLAEVIHHHQAFCAASPGTPPGTRAVFRHLAFQVGGMMAEAIAHGLGLLDPLDYGPSWTFDRRVRLAGFDGVYYKSVRANDGHCLAVFQDRAATFSHVEFGAVVLVWDGSASIRLA
jgi:hypothetical protein